LRIRHRQLAGFGLVLCVLAALFALEAKLAWYGPAHSPSAQISSSKLQPTDAPRLVANAIAASDTVAAHFPAVLPILALSIVLVATCVLPRSTGARQAGPFSFAFTPHVFFRPPPSR
jgi:hypothetical protein